MKDYVSNKEAYEKNREQALKESWSSPNLSGKAGNFKLRKKISISHLNDIGRPEFYPEGMQPKIERENTEPTLPKLARQQSFARGYKNAAKSFDNSNNFEFIMAKHGSYPFLNVYSP